MTDLTTTDLRRAQARLAQTHRTLEEQIAQAAERSKAIFQQGATEESERLRLAFARQIRVFNEEVGRIKDTLHLVERQIQLLGRLIFALEAGIRPDRPPLAGIDWIAALGEAPLHGAAGFLERVKRLLEILIGPALQSAAVGAREETALAVRVPDGDGLVLADGRRVRYIGIDAPEMSTWEGPPEPFALQAKQANRKLVEGKPVRLMRDLSETDRYGRLLRYVYVGNTLVNAELLKSGLARALPIEPDLGQAVEFKRLEWEARLKGKGLWGK